jgi:ribosomal-protein-alanine N-acetyltransferase
MTGGRHHPSACFIIHPMNPPERLETDRLVLRPPTLADGESVFITYAQDPEVTRYLTWQPHPSITQTLEFLAGCMEAWRGDCRFPYIITLKGADSAIGMIEVRLDGFKAEVGYGMGRAHWGKGYMTEAVRALIAWALGQTEIYRVWAICDVDNIASRRVMEKAGMQQEGILRREIIHPNISTEPRDCYLYAIVK